MVEQFLRVLLEVMNSSIIQTPISAEGRSVIFIELFQPMNQWLKRM